MLEGREKPVNYAMRLCACTVEADIRLTEHGSTNGERQAYTSGCTCITMCNDTSHLLGESDVTLYNWPLVGEALVVSMASSNASKD